MVRYIISHIALNSRRRIKSGNEKIKKIKEKYANI